MSDHRVDRGRTEPRDGTKTTGHFSSKLKEAESISYTSFADLTTERSAAGREPVPPLNAGESEEQTSFLARIFSRVTGQASATNVLERAEEPELRVYEEGKARNPVVLPKQPPLATSSLANNGGSSRISAQESGSLKPSRKDGSELPPAGSAQGPGSKNLLSKRYWVSDESAKECYDCKQSFGTFLRRHHCRICGLIFCHRCASNFIAGQPFGLEGEVRVCNFCVERVAAPVDSPVQGSRPSSTSDALFLAPQMFEAAITAIASVPFRHPSRISVSFGETPTEASPIENLSRKPSGGLGQSPSRQAKGVGAVDGGNSRSIAFRDGLQQHKSIDGHVTAQRGASGEISVAESSIPAPGETVWDEEIDDSWNYGTSSAGGATDPVVRPELASPTTRVADPEQLRSQFMKQRRHNRRVLSLRSSRILRPTHSSHSSLASGADVQEMARSQERRASPDLPDEPKRAHSPFFDEQGSAVTHLVGFDRFVLLPILMAFCLCFSAR